MDLMGRDELQREGDLAYMRIAYGIAMNSPDKSTQNGAIIVKDNSFFSLENIVSFGFNTFPEGVLHLPERFLRPDKYKFTEHAERDAILLAAKLGVALNETIMYCPWCACPDCGRAIIQAGLKEVIAYAGPRRWAQKVGTNRIDWDAGIQVSCDMFKEAGVNYRVVDGEIGGIEVLFDGQIVRP